MTQPRIEVEGLKEVQKAIRELGDKGTKTMLRLANKSAADLVAEAARQKAPVLTGALQKSIRSSAGQAFASVKGGGPRVAYFGFVDYGNKVKGGAGVGRKDSHPRPFKAGGRIVYPALAENRQRVTDKYAHEIDAVIRAAGLD